MDWEFEKQRLLEILDGMKTYEDIVNAMPHFQNFFDRCRIEENNYKKWYKKAVEPIDKVQWFISHRCKLAFPLIIGCGERTLFNFLLSVENNKPTLSQTDMRINDTLHVNEQNKVDFKDIPNDYKKIACHRDPFYRFSDFCYIHDIPGKLVLSHIKDCVDKNEPIELGLKPQTDYYTFDQIDLVVPYRNLRKFLKSVSGVSLSDVEHFFPKIVSMNIDDDIHFLKSYYQKDYSILQNVKIWEE